MHSSANYTNMSNHEAERFIKSIPLLRGDIRIAADSCSLIFLNRLHLLEAYANVHTIVLTQALYDEITRVPGNKKIADDQTLYKKLFEGHALTVDAAEASTIHPPNAMSVADRSLIQAYDTLKPDGILTDDKSLCLYCRKHAIPYINTPMAVFVLLYNGNLSHDQYTAALRALYDMGRYGQFVRDYMKKLYTSYCACTNYMQ
jgi:hypothetical protein